MSLDLRNVERVLRNNPTSENIEIARSLGIDVTEYTGEERTRRKAKESDEQKEQIKFIKWVRKHEEKRPDLRKIFAIPNGGFRHWKVARDMKAEGQRSGVWDICLFAARGGYTALWIEMKYGSNGLSKNQKIMRDLFIEEGALCVVCYSSDSAIVEVEEYLSKPRTKIGA